MRLLTIRLRRTTILTVGFAATLIGLGMSRKLAIGPEVAVFGAVLSVPMALNKKRLSLGAFVVMMLGLGLWRGSYYLQQTKTYTSLTKIPVIIHATADSDGVYGEKSQLVFDAKNIELLDPWQEKLVGKIGIKGFGEPMVYKSDRVQVEGKLYPTRGAKQASISFATIKIVSRSSSRIEEIRRRFTGGMISSLPEPLGSFGLGLLIGQRSTLPKRITDQLSTVGLTHIVAVSGYNLTIIVLFAHRLLQKGSKYQATLLTLCLVGVFLLMTGNSASIVRAAIVSMLGLAAWYFGRKVKPVLLILLTASLTALWNPIYIWSDLGWWLSFLAFFGVLVVAPIVSQRFFSRRKPKIVRQVLLETACAQAMTTPLIMYIFGKLSIVSILANLAVVPFVPIAMLFGLLAGIAGALVAALGGWFAWPAQVIMSYMLDVVQLFSGFPHAQIQQKLALEQMFLLYAIIIAFVLICWRKIPKNRKITGKEYLFE